MHVRSLVGFVCAGSVALVLFGAPAAQAAAQAGAAYVEKHRMLPVHPGSIRQFVPIDVEGDGVDELLAVGWSTTSLLYRNVGSGRFELDRDALPTDDGKNRAAAIGDVDGDGDPDIAFAIESSAPGALPAALLINNGAGEFHPAPTLLPATTGKAYDLEFVDVDGDLDLDLVLSTLGGLKLLRNAGNGSYSEAAGAFPASGTQANGIAAGDVDGDLDVDVLATDSGPGGVGLRLFTNDGAGGFTASALSIGPGSGSDVALVDLDLDLDLDVVFTSGIVAIVLHNDGLGGFTALAGEFAGSTSRLAVGDVDGDGWPDAVTAANGRNRWLRNQGNGVLIETTGGFPDDELESFGVTLVDVDADLDLDLLAGNKLPPFGQLALNDGHAGFREVSVLGRLDLDECTAVVCGDLDGDGDLDAVYGSRAYQGSRVYSNDGSGELIEAPLEALPTAHMDVRSMALGDVDRDGDLDLLIGNYAGFESPPGHERLYLNLGDGRFADESARLGAAVDDATTSALFADVNADGWLDVVVLNETWGFSRVLRNLGDATFLELPDALPGLIGVVIGVAGDVDGDGDQDLLIGRFSGPDELWRNDGSGHFAPDPAAMPDLVLATTAMALGDVDLDGDLDALIGARGASLPYLERNRLLLNDGTGQLVESIGQLPPDEQQTHAVTLADLDGDGDLDVLSADSANGTASAFLDRVYTNDGAGHFVTSEPLPERASLTRAFAIGDLDRDGDPDVLRAVTDAELAPLFGATRHLAWRSLPRVGKPLEFVLHGPPGGRYLLLGARATGHTPHACGTWSIDRATVFFRATGTLDARGHAQLTYPVPHSPELVGVELHWQAIVGPPCAFTGAERTLLTVY